MPVAGWFAPAYNRPHMKMRKRHMLIGIVVLLMVGAGVGTAVLLYERWLSLHPITIGAVEDVVLLPWNVTLPARVDTGATTSALDAREMKMLSDNTEVEFRLPDRCGGQRVRRVVHGWRIVTSSDGSSERRPVVRLEFQLGAAHFRTLVTLTDRSHMKFPLLLGRNTLGGRYVVDVTRTNVLAPAATETAVP